MAFLEAEPWFEALRATHRQLRVKPDDTSALVNEEIILLQLGGYSNAIPPLTRVLALTNSPLAIFNRAVAYCLRVGAVLTLAMKMGDPFCLREFVPYG